MRLVIYDKNYSSWSMRAGVALRLTGTAFTEVTYQTAAPAEQAELERLSPTGLFPLLEHGPVRIWDSLAIIEYLAEQFPGAGLWPSDSAARAVARAVSAEMHSGFVALRQQMPMNVRAHYPKFPRTPELGAQVSRLRQMWSDCRERFGANGDFLFGGFGAADCMFAPVIMRLRTYDVSLEGVAGRYARAVEAHPAVTDWVRGAEREGYRNESYDFVTG